ncbi:hypothetical protein XA68_14565 [Ophiocordyceps unilateralis]|uniref:Uncharacterized protein n=1 Tax=Ophiocordyceps unilateralis TaxID=268505 RepID=A0A2A9P9W3_OPHUN|nr:hypothetical protein XA68_14565 [Ophiocordyceps unilateralis]
MASSGLDASSALQQHPSSSSPSSSFDDARTRQPLRAMVEGGDWHRPPHDAHDTSSRLAIASGGRGVLHGHRTLRDFAAASRFAAPAASSPSCTGSGRDADCFDAIMAVHLLAL